MKKNTLNLYKWTAVCCAVLLAALLIPARTEAQTHINVSWKKVLEQENRRVDNQGAASVLGVRVGAQLERIRKQNEARQTMQQAFATMPKDKAPQAKDNYNRLKTLLAKNPLFKGYELKVPVARDLYQINEEAFKNFLAFCDDTANPVSARQYKRGLYLVLQASPSAGNVLLLADVQNKIISFAYNAPADLDQNFLSGKWYELNVR